VAIALFSLAIHPVPARVTDPLRGETEIDVGAPGKVLAIPIPGHTEGSIAYCWGGMIFAGDAVSYQHGKLVPAPALFTADPARNARSVAALAGHLRIFPLDRICTGHGGCSPAGSAQPLLDAFAASVQ
jgi:glyoxylase-like metal-dependent hydrolase (beta-lactamase superfamily II)